MKGQTPETSDGRTPGNQGRVIKNRVIKNRVIENRQERGMDETSRPADSNLSETEANPRGQEPGAFSIRRYSVRNMSMMMISSLIFLGIALYAGVQELWTLTGLAGGGLITIATCLILMARMSIRRVEVENWIQRLGNGDFNHTVQPRGRDELSKVCVALEMLRMRAMRATQLNQVQQLSEELAEKNEESEMAFRELQRTQDRMVSRRKVAELGELSAGLAHELRNPLQFIKNFAEASAEASASLQEEEDGNLNQEQLDLVVDISESMSHILRHSERANRIIFQMSAMGRHEHTPRRRIDINSLLTEQAHMAHQAMITINPDVMVQMTSYMDPEAGEVEVIPEDLSRVFTNLVSNACQATFEKAEEENDESYSPQINIGTKRQDQQVMITVWDNGVGMTPEVMEKIFNPFFTTKNSTLATGLGLSLCHDIVQGHGGTIAADSRPGRYTKMTVTIPDRREEQDR